MNDEKGKRFLELIDEQNNLQWSIVAKLSSLISLKWNSIELQNQKSNQSLRQKNQNLKKLGQNTILR